MLWPAMTSAKTSLEFGQGDCVDIRITPLGATEAAIEWIRHSFLLDVEARARLGTHFLQIGGVATLGISYRLDFPRDFSLLPDVRRAVLAHAFPKATP